ncbi:hypothetical protein HaLaN_17214 [Haematococcus lacustris]|uniref:Uncharacterized protein n=1 Tax=Haematococcus lacustris TaxID=44745 RepID=A0A699ZBR1_HAELA|nr:hypothetical protein HaLaN_17214 [Haematococcus lacustris]
MLKGLFTKAEPEPANSEGAEQHHHQQHKHPPAPYVAHRVLVNSAFYFTWVPYCVLIAAKDSRLEESLFFGLAFSGWSVLFNGGYLACRSCGSRKRELPYILDAALAVYFAVYLAVHEARPEYRPDLQKYTGRSLDPRRGPDRPALPGTPSDRPEHWDGGPEHRLQLRVALPQPPGHDRAHQVAAREQEGAGVPAPHAQQRTAPELGPQLKVKACRIMRAVAVDNVTTWRAHIHFHVKHAPRWIMAQEVLITRKSCEVSSLLPNDQLPVLPPSLAVAIRNYDKHYPSCVDY